MFSFGTKGEKMKRSLLPLTRLFMIQCLLTMILAISFNSAHAQRRGGGHNQGGQHPANQSQNIQVNQYLYESQKLDLDQLLRVHQHQRQGKEVVGITIKAQSTQYNSKLIVVLNGQRLIASNLNSQMSQTDLMLPSLRGSDKLILKVKGGAFIKAIRVDLQDIYSPGPIPGQDEVLRAQVNRSYRGISTLPIKALINQSNPGNLQGAKVDKVILKASSLRGRATATLLINGRPVGMPQNISYTQDRLVFDLPNYSANTIGHDINTIQIELRGNVDVKMVGLKVQKRGHGGGHGGGNSQSVHVQVNRAFSHHALIDLESLLVFGPRINIYAPIQSITIVAEGQGAIHLNALGLPQSHMQVRGVDTQTFRVQGFQTAIKDINLSITGRRITIKSMIINFK